MTGAPLCKCEPENKKMIIPDKNQSILVSSVAFGFSTISLFLGSFKFLPLAWFLATGCTSLVFQMLLITRFLLSQDRKYKIQKSRNPSHKNLLSSSIHSQDDHLAIEVQPYEIENQGISSPLSEAGPKVAPLSAEPECKEDTAPCGSNTRKSLKSALKSSATASRSNSAIEAENLAKAAKSAANSAGGTWGIFHGKNLSVAIDGDHTVSPKDIAAPQNSKDKVSDLTTKIPPKQKFINTARKVSSLLKALEEKNIVETPIMKAIRLLRSIAPIFDESDTVAVAVEEVVKILQDSDNLHSVSMGLRNNSVLGETTKRWLKATVEETEHVYRVSSGDRWKKLRLISKKIGLKQLLENNRRMMCSSMKFTFNQGKPDSDYQLQVHTSKWVSEQAEKPSRDLRRLGTQEMIPGENGEEDHMMVSVFSHPQFTLEKMVEIEHYFTEKDILSWEFSVLDLEKRTDGNALWFVGMILFSYHDIMTNFHIHPTTLSAFLMECQRTYCFDPDPHKRNIYHNSTHGADVALTVGQFLENAMLGDTITGLQAFALLTGAICHDYRHPGLNNAYLIKTQNNMAVTYNDSSVLENFHCAEATRLMAQEKFNILSGVEKDIAKSFRSSFIKVILATDLAHAFQYINKFKSALEKEDKQAGTGFSKDNSDSQILLMQFAIKCADICHPARPWELHVQWSNLIADEFFAQGDREKEEGLPISPLCDRAQVELAKGQCDFIDFLVKPCLEPFSKFCQTEEWMSHLNTNYERWKIEQEAENEPRKKSLIQVWEDNQRRSTINKQARSRISTARGTAMKGSTENTVRKLSTGSSISSVFRKASNTRRKASRSTSKVVAANAVEQFKPEKEGRRRSSILNLLRDRRRSSTAVILRERK
mmetsp:Transcript_40024/g.51577  ORF Transcript_40024/g.51577 Transcript_40024/m.51577 type:complete len:878 (+) Transcript_40024:28-2661(+)